MSWNKIKKCKKPISKNLQEYLNTLPKIGKEILLKDKDKRIYRTHIGFLHSITIKGYEVELDWVLDGGYSYDNIVAWRELPEYP